MVKDGKSDGNKDGLSHLDQPARSKRKPKVPARFASQAEGPQHATAVAKKAPRAALRKKIGKMTAVRGGARRARGLATPPGTLLLQLLSLTL